MALTFKEARERYGAAMGLKAQVTALQRTMAFYARPQNSDWHTYDARGRLRGGGLIDATMIKVVRKVADRVVSRLMPEGGSWARITVSESQRQALDPASRHALDQGLEVASMIVQRSLERSDIRKAVSECCKDFLAMGLCSAMPVRYIDNSIGFGVNPANKVILEDAPNMRYGGVFIHRQMKIRDWKRMYPGFPHPPLQDDQTTMIVFGFIPHGAGAYSFAYDERGEEFLFMREHFPHERPIVSATAMVAGGETYGVGLAGEMLPEAQMLNSMRADLLQAVKMWGNPMWLVNKRAQVRNFQWRPGGRVAVNADAMEGGANPIRPIDVGGNPSTAFAAVNDSMGRIHDQMGLMATPAQPDQPVRTATEWVIAQSESRGDLDAFMIEFSKEFVEPLLKQAVELHRQLGKLPPQLIVDGDRFSLEIVGDSEKQNKLMTIQSAKALLEMGAMMPEEASIAINKMKLLDDVADALGLTGALFSPEQRQQAQLAAMAALEQGQ